VRDAVNGRRRCRCLLSGARATLVVVVSRPGVSADLVQYEDFAAMSKKMQAATAKDMFLVMLRQVRSCLCLCLCLCLCILVAALLASRL
jgi:hypothetical protein